MSNARFAIIQLMPEQLQPLMHAYHRCESHDQYVFWQAELVDKVIEMAVPLRPDEDSDPGPRAVCPLCGRGGHSPFNHGYSLPAGLRRHLWGNSNAIPCAVTHEVFSLAGAALSPKLVAHANAELKALEEELEQRRKEEPLYQTALDAAPLLLDESLGCGALPRTQSELAWAEQRLRDLGFQIACIDRVKRYSLETPDAVILADPRPRGEIHFLVYTKPLPQNGRPKIIRSFSIRDDWKHDLRGKFESRLANQRG